MSLLPKLLLIIAMSKSVRPETEAPEFEEPVFATGYVPAVSVKEYCRKPFECDGHKHTICKYSCKMEPKCTDFLAWEFDNERRQLLLDLHNFYRNAVAEGNETRGIGLSRAAYMRSMAYEVRHEPIIHCWLRRCQFEHDVCRGFKDTYSTGQNIYSRRGSTGMAPDIEDGRSFFNDSLFGWYIEIKLFKPGLIEEFNPKGYKKPIGHATQLLWGETNNVGCGFVRYRDWQRKDFYEWLLMCNYAPRGNVVNQPVYIKGDLNCDKFPVDDDFTNLCGRTTQVSKIRNPITIQIGENLYTHIPKDTGRFKPISKLPYGGTVRMSAVCYLLLDIIIFAHVIVIIV